MNDACTTPPEALNRPRRNVWPLTVVDAFDLECGTRRLRLVSEVDGFRYLPGQRLALRLPHASGESPLPFYTVTGFDAVEERLEIDVAVRDDSPAARWVRAARLGDPVIAEVTGALTALAASGRSGR
ncbi:MAG: siderophore-interacting protein [Caulobacterales bacterium]